MKEPRKMPRTRTRDLRQRFQRPVSGRVGGNGVLHSMNCRMNMVAPFEPWRELRVNSAAADIDHQIACYLRGTTMVRDPADKVQHQVNSGGDSGAAVATAIFNEKPVLKDSCLWSRRCQLCACGMMCRACAAIQQPSPPRQQGSRANGNQCVLRAENSLKPAYDSGFGSIIVFQPRVGHVECLIHVAGQDNHGVFGEGSRQRRYLRQHHADRTGYRDRRADIGDMKTHSFLHLVRPSQHFDRACDVK